MNVERYATWHHLVGTIHHRVHDQLETEQRLGDCSIESATAVTFSSAVLGRPDLLFNADDVCRKLETQRRIVLPVGKGS